MSAEESKNSQVAEQAEEKKEKVEAADEPKGSEATKAKEESTQKSEQNQDTAVKSEKQETEEEKSVSSPKIEEILKTIEQMTVLELSDLVKALEQKFGVTAAVPVAGAVAAQPGVASAQPQEEEKSTFDVILEQVGDKKIQVIKEIRAITNLGLKEAKDLVDNAPKPIKEGASKEEAEEIKKKIEAVGATVVLK